MLYPANVTKFSTAVGPIAIVVRWQFPVTVRVKDFVEVTSGYSVSEAVTVIR